MKFSSKKVIVILFVSVIHFSNSQAQALKTALDSLSYAIGVNVGDNIRNQKLSVNADILAKGIKDAMANNKSIMNSESSSAFIQSYFQRESEKVGKENKSLAATERNKEMTLFGH